MNLGLTGLAAVGLLLAATASPAWELVAHSPAAVAPQLPSTGEAVELKATAKTPLWWLREPHRLALQRGWIGVPSRDSGNKSCQGAGDTRSLDGSAVARQ
jgi:hypothetical protein